MTDASEQVRWTQEDVERRLEAVRAVLLDFLRERTRLEWYRHKVRWRLSRRYIWPGAPDGLLTLLDEAVEKNGGVEAFMAHVQKRQREISDAIERYNLALQRWMEQEHGAPVNEFDPATLTELRHRRITFQGTRDELLRRARQLSPESGPELIPELLCLRLAILSEDVRDELFSEVGALIAGEAADATPSMSAEERDALAEEVEIRLRSLDRHHVARLLAENYAEARRFMDVDGKLERFETLCGEERQAPGASPARTRVLEALRRVLIEELAYLEDLYPMTAGTHERETTLLQRDD